MLKQRSVIVKEAVLPQPVESRKIDTVSPMSIGKAEDAFGACSTPLLKTSIENDLENENFAI